jgi:acyl-CoA thioesterase FadM
MDGWTESWRGIVAPWECDTTEHFTIAYYFDRLADASSMMAGRLGLDGVPRTSGSHFDVRFVRELRAGASFHIASAPIGLDEAALRLGHQFVDSANDEVTAWVEETLDIAAAPLPRESKEAIGRLLLPWPGPAVERRTEPITSAGFMPTARDRVKPMDLDADGNFSLSAFVFRFTAGCIQALAAIGATADYMQAERRGYSTFELALQIRKKPRLGSQVLVETAITHLGNSSVRFLHRMRDSADGSEFARLGQFGVQLDLGTRRPAALPEPLKTRAARRLLLPIG